MLCRSDHEDLPRSSTSGGQLEAVAMVVAAAPVAVAGVVVCFFVMAAHDEKAALEVQLRHLSEKLEQRRHESSRKRTACRLVLELDL